MYQREVDVDTLNAVKSLLADVSSVSPSSEQRNVSQQTLRLSTYPHQPYVDTFFVLIIALLYIGVVSRLMADYVP